MHKYELIVKGKKSAQYKEWLSLETLKFEENIKAHSKLPELIQPKIRLNAILNDSDDSDLWLSEIQEKCIILSYNGPICKYSFDQKLSILLRANFSIEKRCRKILLDNKNDYVLIKFGGYQYGVRKDKDLNLLSDWGAVSYDISDRARLKKVCILPTTFLRRRKNHTMEIPFQLKDYLKS